MPQQMSETLELRALLTKASVAALMVVSARHDSSK